MCIINTLAIKMCKCGCRSEHSCLKGRPTEHGIVYTLCSFLMSTASLIGDSNTAGSKMRTFCGHYCSKKYFSHSFI